MWNSTFELDLRNLVIRQTCLAVPSYDTIICGSKKKAFEAKVVKVSREPKQTGPQLFYFARRYTRDGYHVTCMRVIRYFYLDRAIKQPSPLEKDIPWQYVTFFLLLSSQIEVDSLIFFSGWLSEVGLLSIEYFPWEMARVFSTSHFLLLFWQTLFTYVSASVQDSLCTADKIERLNCSCNITCSQLKTSSFTTLSPKSYFEVSVIVELPIVSACWIKFSGFCDGLPTIG